MKKALLIGLPIAVFLGVPIYVVASQINWGYHVEDGGDMAGALGGILEASQGQIAEANALASEVCGEPVIFEREKKGSWWAAMAERPKVGHFFVHGPFRNVIWMVLGLDGRTCAARFEVVMRDHGHVLPIPSTLLPAPHWNWDKWLWVESYRLIDRITSPTAPPGVRALLPGECAWGMLRPGDTVQYQVRIPALAYHVKTYLRWDWRHVEPLHVEITRDGKPIRPFVDKLGPGTYDVAMHNQVTARRRFAFRIGWGLAGNGCPTPDGWWDWQVPLPATPSKD